MSDELKTIIEKLDENRKATEKVGAEMHEFKRDTTVSLTKLQADADNAKERSAEDRTEQTRIGSELHERTNEALQQVHTNTAELQAHIKDDNRHQGVAPGGGNAKGLAIGGGVLGIIYAIIEGVKALS